ncbi:uncharacterized protein MONBRDRAFT_22899 [Monosiga brevicollis MX1]|uniref:Uncharacterized protein n=1 Tax=Monosiga brevicollis TaxID=81824 RepID=A9USE3_MONBE|nr:uncharacterized protein MONBRDRAFT_22899 [Monosiga brevicollis MX1]EDQ92086.1 predicted protein [Monosiga brevicollis MX1]|eukprot:XP_001743372.1 hypothetical protein [Monosiga brevicollis MX1]
MLFTHCLTAALGIKNDVRLSLKGAYTYFDLVESTQVTFPTEEQYKNFFKAVGSTNPWAARRGSDDDEDMVAWIGQRLIKFLTQPKISQRTELGKVIHFLKGHSASLRAYVDIVTAVQEEPFRVALWNGKRQEAIIRGFMLFKMREVSPDPSLRYQAFVVLAQAVCDRYLESDLAYCKQFLDKTRWSDPAFFLQTILDVCRGDAPKPVKRQPTFADMLAAEPSEKRPHLEDSSELRAIRDGKFLRQCVEATLPQVNFCFIWKFILYVQPDQSNEAAQFSSS